MLHKSLLVPINSRREILIQDRRGFKKPDWGFFGGSIEAGEQPIDAVLRETKEELDLDLTPADVEFISTRTASFKDIAVERHFYLYRTDQVNFEVHEGNGCVWLSAADARARLDRDERFDDLWQAIEAMLD